MADLPSILGGMAQGFIDFGKGAVDLFGTGGAAIGDLVDTIKTGKVSTKNQDDFRKWLYDTNDVQDAAAKGLGTALNGVQTVTDYIPGIGAVTKNPLFNAGQGALGGLADEFKTYGKDYDLGRAGERAAVSAGGALAATGLADALKGSSNGLLKSATAQGLGRGAIGGAITGGGYAAIDGGDVMQGALQGAGTGALIGGATGAMQDFMPRKATYDMALTDEEKAARIANAKNMLANEQNPERIAELNNQIKDLGGTLADADMAVSSPKLTPEQEAYFKDSVIRDENGNLKELYHGSPNGEFYTFDMKYANPENDWGKGFYFTDNEADVHKNYVGGGPDFDNKVARRAEQIADEQGIDYDAAKKQARNEMYKDDYLINAYTNLKNPATVGKTSLFDGSEYDVKPLADYDNIDDYYNDLIYELTDDVINDTNIDYNYKNDLMGVLSDAYYNGGMGLQQLKDRLNELYIEDYDGNLAGNDVARSIVQSLGFDGIIDPTVSGKFSNMGIENGTTHYIAFEPNQIKNTNNLRPTENPDIRYSKATPGQSLEKTLANGDAEINRVGSANVAPVDQTTLPDSLKAVQDYLDEGNYIKDIENFAGKPYPKLTNQDYLDYAISLKNPKDKAFYESIIKDMVDDGTTTYEKYAASTARNNRLNKLRMGSYDDINPKELASYVANHRQALSNGAIKDVDAELSDRLGIGRSNTLMMDNNLPPDALGVYDPTKTAISIDTRVPEENAINTLAHERLHSFQTEGDFKRYDKRVTDAYEELSKDLNKYLKTPEETAKRYAFDADYWGNEREQQSRMLQQYLENKGFTRGGLQKSNIGEWGNEINPAFDKFFDKLRDLSKRGVALPALAALFGGGAYMASQNNDKEKEVK